jgi:SH3-like domain-containing protein
MNRPGADYPESRLPYFKKGSMVSIGAEYHDWVFITDRNLDRNDENSGYGWVPRNILSSCKSKDGTT